MINPFPMMIKLLVTLKPKLKGVILRSGITFTVPVNDLNLDLMSHLISEMLNGDFRQHITESQNA